MFRRWFEGIFTASLLFVAAVAHAGDAAAVFARYKGATGGAAWDKATALRAKGSIATGGLSGDLVVVQDLVRGRSVATYQLGPVQGADGFDGTTGWNVGPGGEVTALDAPEAKRRAVTQAWLNANAYWYPERMQATYGAVADKTADGHAFRVVEATPAGGDPVGLWFDAKSGLLARVVQREAQDTATTVYDEYREVGGVRMPYHAVTDRTDAAGRTDPRARVEIRYADVALNGAIADADFAMPEMAATARIADASGITQIKFDLVNNHIYADGTIDGRKARFLVDTGGSNVLTPAAAEKFGIKGEGDLPGRGVGDEAVKAQLAHVGEVTLGGASLAKPVFVILDLGPLTSVEGVDFDGLVGFEMFRRFGVTIDYAGRVLTLAEPSKFVPPAGATVVPFELSDTTPLIAGTLDGAPIRVSVDTGSRASLSMHSPFVREHGLVERYHAAPEAVVGWGVGGPSRGRPARFGALKLGDREISGVAGDLYVGDKGAFSNPDMSGNLGGGVLKRFTVAFDYSAKRMYLAPNADFAQPDAFDRSGLFLLGDGDALVIADVAPQSAAAKAGLQAKDRVTSIGGEAANSQTLTAMRAKLRELPAGTKLPVERVRDGKKATVELALADRIAAK
jgi:aspartyl protease/PDZ domain-containing protein